MRNLEKWARKSLVCCKQNILGDSGGSSEDQNADRSVGSKGCAHEGLYWEMNQKPFMLILAKNLCEFLPRPWDFASG
jgi:hypothetical protein